MRGIRKAYPGVLALDDVDFDLLPGEVHALLGENGAGKSTLMNILYGLYQADRGEILINGEVAKITNSAAAIRHGIGMVHQHFMLVQPFTVLENVMLGAEEDFALTQSVASTRALIERMDKDYGLTVNPDVKIADLPVGLQLLAPPLGEAVMLRGADAFERRTDWHARRPPEAS